MPVINRSRTRHIIFSYLANSFMSHGSGSNKILKYTGYRYSQGVSILPILDKSSPFICTVALFDGKSAISGGSLTIDQMMETSVFGFFIDPSFADIEINYRWNEKKDTFMLGLKKKVLETVQSFFKDDPAAAAAGISAFKELPGVMSFVNLFVDADKLAGGVTEIGQILANSALFFPEEQIKGFEGVDIDVPNIRVKRTYICYSHTSDPYRDVLEDLKRLQLLPRLFSPQYFQAGDIRYEVATQQSFQPGKETNWKLFEAKVYFKLIEIIAFLYYYTNMGAQSYLGLNMFLHGLPLPLSDQEIRSSSNTEDLATKISKRGKLDYEKYFLSRPTFDKDNLPTLSYCLVLIGISLMNVDPNVAYTGYSVSLGYDDNTGQLNTTNNSSQYKNLSIYGFLVAWFFGSLFDSKDNFDYFQSTRGATKFGAFFPYIAPDYLTFYNVARMGGSSSLIESISRADQESTMTLGKRYYNTSFFVPYQSMLSNYRFKYLDAPMGVLAKIFLALKSLSIVLSFLYLKFGALLLFLKTLNLLTSTDFLLCSYIPDIYHSNSQELKYKSGKSFNYENDRSPNALLNLGYRQGQSNWYPDNGTDIVTAILFQCSRFNVSDAKNHFGEANSEDTTYRLKSSHARQLPLASYAAFLVYHSGVFGLYGLTLGRIDHKGNQLIKSLTQSAGLEPCGIMLTFKIPKEKYIPIIQKYNQGNDVIKIDNNQTVDFNNLLFNFATMIGGIATKGPESLFKWGIVEKLPGSSVNPSREPNLSTFTYYAGNVLSTIFRSFSSDDTGFYPSGLEPNIFLDKFSRVIGIDDLGKNIIEVMKNKNNVIDPKEMFDKVNINIFAGAMMVVGLLYYYEPLKANWQGPEMNAIDSFEAKVDDYAERNGIPKDKIKYEMIEGVDLEKYYHMMYSSVPKDYADLTYRFNIPLNGMMTYSLFGFEHTNCLYCAKKDTRSFSSISFGKEYDDQKHTIWFNEQELKSDKINDKDTLYKELEGKDPRNGYLIYFEDRPNFKTTFSVFMFRPKQVENIGPRCAFSYYMYDYLYYLGMYNVFTKSSSLTIGTKLLFMNTRMPNISTQAMNKSEDITLMSTYRHPGENVKTLLEKMNEIYRKAYDVQQGSAGYLRDLDGSSMTPTGTGVQFTATENDIFLHRVLKFFNVLLMLPPGNYNYVPYFKTLVEAYINGSTSVNINGFNYIVSYYLIILFNVNAIGNVPHLKNDVRVLPYLLPKNVSIKTSEAYTYPFDYSKEVSGKDLKSRPLFVTLEIQFTPVNDLLYIYATFLGMDQIKEALGVIGDSSGHTSVKVTSPFSGSGHSGSSVIVTGDLETDVKKFKELAKEGLSRQADIDVADSSYASAGSGKAIKPDRYQDNVTSYDVNESPPIRFKNSIGREATLGGCDD